MTGPCQAEPAAQRCSIALLCCYVVQLPCRWYVSQLAACLVLLRFRATASRSEKSIAIFERLATDITIGNTAFSSISRLLKPSTCDCHCPAHSDTPQQEAALSPPTTPMRHTTLDIEQLSCSHSSPLPYPYWPVSPPFSAPPSSAYLRHHHGTLF